PPEETSPCFSNSSRRSASPLTSPCSRSGTHCSPSRSTNACARTFSTVTTVAIQAQGPGAAPADFRQVDHPSRRNRGELALGKRQHTCDKAGRGPRRDRGRSVI